MFNQVKSYLFAPALILTIFYFAGCSGSDVSTNAKLKEESHSCCANPYDTVQPRRFDNGKMWTFENPPIEYFKEAYNFTPTEEWFDKARLSSLRFANYCSASFISEDGLIMTNHHCARQSVTEVQEEGEDLHENGFFAEYLSEERPVPGLFVEQLVLIRDVTEEIKNAMKEGANETEKAQKRTERINELEKQYKDETGLICKITSLYNGAKYSIYCYKRYNDVRLVFAPETQLGFFGGDYDNFTYPRYNLDFSFFRAYDEDGKPAKTPHYFKWSPNGAIEEEPVFVIGNPGTTGRLRTIAQLEFARDYQYRATLKMIENLISVYTELIKMKPEDKARLTDRLFSFANAQKVYQGQINGLNDKYLFSRKRNFEKKFKDEVFKNEQLKLKYGFVWDSISVIKGKIKSYYNEMNAFVINPLMSPRILNIASTAINIAEELAKPEGERSNEYQAENLEPTLSSMFPEDYDYEEDFLKTSAWTNFIFELLGSEHDVSKSLFEGKKGKDAAKTLFEKSKIKSAEEFIALVKKGSDAILNAKDPFIEFILFTQDKFANYRSFHSELTSREKYFSQFIGEALFEVYGYSIPPDATFTLRIADGIVKGYDYNGTIAPVKTTFYGIYDRFYSFKKEFPWNLPDRWIKPPAELDLETPINFVSTNDITGGNSGSPVINKNLEIVGVAFDGNIESLPGDFIFTTESNRTVSVASEGMYEALKDLYKANRIIEELNNGKIPEAYLEKAK